jgi:hypothetical protein
VTDRDELERQLEKGALRELPPNIPPGFMGEIGPDLRKPDTFKPSTNAGLLQESTWETRWLVIGILYLLVITSPFAAYLLWRDPKMKLRTKVLTSILMGVGLAALLWAVRG